jgi:hypothetical protein
MESNSRLAAHRTVGFVAVSAANLLAVLPGIAVFSDGVWAAAGQEKAFGTAITVLSTVLLLQLSLYRHVFRRMYRGRVIRVTSILALVGLTGLGAFRAAYVTSVYEGPRGEMLVPIFWSPPLERLAASHLGMARAIELDPGGVRNEIRNAPMLQWFTEGIFLGSYLVMDLSLVAILAILGWRVGRSDLATEQENDATAEHEAEAAMPRSVSHRSGANGVPSYGSTTAEEPTVARGP